MDRATTQLLVYITKYIATLQVTCCYISAQAQYFLTQFGSYTYTSTINLHSNLHGWLQCHILVEHNDTKVIKQLKIIITLLCHIATAKRKIGLAPNPMNSTLLQLFISERLQHSYM